MSSNFHGGKVPGKTAIGSKYHYLTVVAKGYTTGRNRYWWCTCDCGTITKLIAGGALRAGTTGSCGCQRTALKRRSGFFNGRSAQTDVWVAYRWNARKRGLVFALTRQEFDALILQPCVICGRDKTAVSRRTFAHTGIDRIDNTRGYEPDNVRPMCVNCNKGKSALSENEFQAWIAAIRSKA